VYLVSVGWKGTGSRALEFAGDGPLPGESTARRARFRFNGSTGELEASIDQQVYLPVAGASVISQTEWYVDPTLGSDKNAGTADSPLQTFTEFCRRVRHLIGPDYASNPAGVSVYVLGDVDAEPNIQLEGSFPGVLWIYGTPTTLREGTITGRTAWVHTPGSLSQGTITDSALTAGSWSDYNGVDLRFKKIVLTSGVNAGAWAWILRDDGAKVATVSCWWNQDTFTEVTPDVGDAYKVVELTKMLSPWVIKLPRIAVFQDFEFLGVPALFQQNFYASDCDLVIYGCKFYGTGDGTQETVFRRCGPFITGSWFGDGLTFEHCDGWIVGSVFYGGSAGSHIDSSTYYMSYCSTVAFGVTAAVGIGLRDRSMLHMYPDASFASLCNGFQPYGVLQLRPGAQALIQGTCYTVGASGGTGIWCASGARVYWNPVNVDCNAKFSFAGTANDFSIGEVTKTIADLNTVGYVNPANGAMVTPTKRHPTA